MATANTVPADGLQFITRRLNTLATPGGNLRNSLEEAFLLTREAISLGALSETNFASFRDFFDIRHDADPRHRRWLAFCLATDWLADNAADLWEQPPQISPGRFPRASIGIPRVYCIERMPLVAGLIEQATRRLNSHSESQSANENWSEPPAKMDAIAKRLGISPSTLARRRADLPGQYRTRGGKGRFQILIDALPPEFRDKFT